MRWLGRCTTASSNSPPLPPRSGRATWSGGINWICGCEVSTRLMKFASRPASIADMKTITATPIETPPIMNSVCSLPSRRKRTAAIHSNGNQWFMIEVSWPNRAQALAGQQVRGGGYGEIALRRAAENLDVGIAADAEGHRLFDGAAVAHAHDPRAARQHVVDRAHRYDQRLVAASRFDVDRYRHVLAQIVRRLRHHELHLDRGAGDVDTGIDVADDGIEPLVGER